MEAALLYQEQADKTRAIVKKAFETNETEVHYSFRITLDGLINLVAKKLVGKYEEPTKEFLYQLNIAISYIRSHYIINELILSGDLIEAYTLIRKQLEKLTRLHEIDSLPLKILIGQTPKVNNVFKEVAKVLYRELSEVAHFGKPKVSQLISFRTSDGKNGPSLFPTYKESALICYDKNAFVALYFTHWLIEFTIKHNKEYESEEDENTFSILEKMALDCNIIKTDKK
ncbi:hypothetical protein [Flavobacterium franklandianum]|uniref:Uncharacterized protein n=2 Tax=Flavobacterium franklandianum TaxID=2594430 RepID=A0A553CT12_9FLAO|nr:hypothetical protein [Flavobacterium franklandianum]TRX23637.1 hypothetical protein FNW17_00205 [Flavobacterium franklandianum]